MKTEPLHGYTKTVLTTRDGQPLRVYDCRKTGRQTVLLLNPIGVSIDLVSPLLNMLQLFFDVISWESRGTSLPDDPTVIAPEHFTVNAHLDDMRFIFSSLALNPVDHIIGYCSGAELATIVATLPEAASIKSLSLVSPSLKLKQVAENDYQQFMASFLLDIAREGVDYARQVRSLLEGDKKTDDPLSQLAEINRRPFKNEYTALMYAWFERDLLNYHQEHIIAGIHTPALVLHADNDTIAHPDISRYVATHLPNARLSLFAKGGHFIFYSNHLAVEEVISFMLSSG